MGPVQRLHMSTSAIMTEVPASSNLSSGSDDNVCCQPVSVLAPEMWLQAPHAHLPILIRELQEAAAIRSLRHRSLPVQNEPRTR